MTTPEEYRAQLELFLWEATGWRWGNELISGVLTITEQYIATANPQPAPSPEPKSELDAPTTMTAWGTVDFGALWQEITESRASAEPDSATMAAQDDTLRMCRKCGPKHPDEFYRDKKNTDGRRFLCKSCDADAKRDWRRRRDERVAGAVADSGSPSGDHA